MIFTQRSPYGLLRNRKKRAQVLTGKNQFLKCHERSSIDDQINTHQFSTLKLAQKIDNQNLKHPTYLRFFKKNSLSVSLHKDIDE